MSMYGNTKIKYSMFLLVQYPLMTLTIQFLKFFT